MSMLIPEFEKKIKKEIHPRLRVQYNNRDVAGVYLGHVYIGVAIPRKEIFSTSKPSYQDANGVKHRSIAEAEKAIKAKVKKYE